MRDDFVTTLIGVEAARVLGKMEPIFAGRTMRTDVPTGLRVRGDRSASAPGGTGTGLYRVRVLVNALGGRVWFEGDPGSWVTAFALPAADDSGTGDAEALAWRSDGSERER